MAAFKDFNDLNIRQHMMGPVISLGSSCRVFASFLMHLISCSFWLGISHAAVFDSVSVSALESTGKCQNLLHELELSLLGQVLMSPFGP